MSDELNRDQRAAIQKTADFLASSAYRTLTQECERLLASAPNVPQKAQHEMLDATIASMVETYIEAIGTLFPQRLPSMISRLDQVLLHAETRDRQPVPDDPVARALAACRSPEDLRAALEGLLDNPDATAMILTQDLTTGEITEQRLTAELIEKLIADMESDK